MTLDEAVELVKRRRVGRTYITGKPSPYSDDVLVEEIERLHDMLRRWKEARTQWAQAEGRESHEGWMDKTHAIEDEMEAVTTLAAPKEVT